MPEDRADRAQSETDVRRARLAIPALLFTALVIALLTVAGIGARYWARGDFDIVHALLILFFSINLWICYWEICLFFKRDYIELRAEYWRRREQETGRAPTIEFLTGKVPLAKVLSPKVWADVWAAYSQIDGSYADRRTYGFNVDIANGFVTPVPTLVLYVAFTFDILPALAAGVIGAMMFWQLTYATSVYWVSFFVARRQHRVSRKDMNIYIWALNSPWVLFALLGLYVSIRLIADGDYSVLGY
ncbi:MAG: hypothetical protein OXN81_10130 [Alphaproteobacteria bacterium]|nr:hypothetical protein [Alphaproteobacteria bacterium]